MSRHSLNFYYIIKNIINISEVSSSDDESPAKPHKEELKKYIKVSDDDESSQEQITPKSSPQDSPIIQSKKSISKDPSQKYLVQGADFKKLQKKAKKLGANCLQYSKRKNRKYMVEYNDKKIHFGSAQTEDYLTHHHQVRREKYLFLAKRFTDKDGRPTHELPFYPNYWSVNLLN